MKTLKMLMAGLLVVCAVACGNDGPDDDAKLSELDESEMTALCEDACDGRTEYSLTCEDDGATVTYSAEADDVSNCQSDCEAIKTESCDATAGDVRTALSTPDDCEEAAVTLAANFKLFSCSQ